MSINTKVVRFNGERTWGRIAEEAAEFEKPQSKDKGAETGTLFRKPGDRAAWAT